MATLKERLTALRLGTKSPEQLEREASPVMTAMFNRRAPSYDEIMEQRRLNREQGVWYPIFDGNLRSGERLTNINGITYKIPAGIEIPPNTTGFNLSQDIPQSSQYEPQYDMSPPSASPAVPRRREITPPAPAQREMPQDVMSFRPSPNFPARLPSSTEVPMPQPRTDFTPSQRQAPIPGPNLFTPPAMEPQVEKPIDTETVLNSLLARYDALYSDKPPVAPEPRMPEPRDFGVPVGPASPGLMSPPDIPAPNMPGVSEFDYGSASGGVPNMSEEQLDEMFNEYLKSASEDYLRDIGR